MVMGAHIDETLESFVRGSIVLILNSSLNVCNEILKFFLILLMLYYLTLWSFQILDELALTIPLSTEFGNKSKSNFKTEEYVWKTHPIADETNLRIGAPDEKLIEQRANLLEQLEIEAEFEENIKQQTKIESNLGKPNLTALKPGNSDEIDLLKDLFISQIKRQLNETSRPCQTTKTSLGKKSMPRENILQTEFQADYNFNDQSEVVD